MKKFVLVVLALFVLIGSAQAQPVPTVNPTMPNRIAGNMVSDSFGWPLASDGPMGGRVNLFRVGEDQSWNWVNSSNCWDGTGGCVYGDGSFYFYVDFQYKSLLDGTYVVEATASNHLVSRQRVTVSAANPQPADLKFRLSLVPVHLSLLQSASSIPVGGGKLWTKVRLYNNSLVDYGPVIVTITVSGPGVTSEFVTFDVVRVVPLTEVGHYYDLTVDADIPANFANGATYCGTIRVGSAKNPGEQYGPSWSFCAAKGVGMRL